MKKIQMMMLMMLTAFMGFALQSCGSDDDNNDTRQTYTIGLEIVDKGDLTAEEAAMVNTMIQQAVSKAETTVTATESQAKAALDAAINLYKSDLEAAFKGSGNTKKFTMAFVLKNASGKVVYQRNVLVEGETVIVK